MSTIAIVPKRFGFCSSSDIWDTLVRWSEGVDRFPCIKNADLHRAWNWQDGDRRWFELAYITSFVSEKLRLAAWLISQHWHSSDENTTRFVALWTSVSSSAVFRFLQVFPRLDSDQSVHKQDECFIFIYSILLRQLKILHVWAFLIFQLSSSYTGCSYTLLDTY